MATTKLWGGRFAKNEDPLFADFNRSWYFDRELLESDIQGSLAYARALERAGIFSRAERRRVERGLTEILQTHRRNPKTAAGSKVEDVHTHVEEALQTRVGSIALKLHTGRSRNDQVATDLRLYLRQKTDEIGLELDSLLRAVATLAGRHLSVILPGYTHLQPAQPVLFAHYLLAYGEMFLRDRDRLRETRSRLNVCPLGSGALSGTAYDVDRDRLARDLGFASASENSMDAVADRDFVLDFLFFAGVLMTHLSRMAEDWILYSSSEFGFVELDDSVASGSSLMPQKKNPDALELIRAKAGRTFGHLFALLTVLKGLPLTYNKDLQEDKEALFDTLCTLQNSLRMMRRVIETLHVRPENMREAATGGYLNATELADYLVAKKVPFREAHHLVGKIVLHAAELGLNLEQLPLAGYRSFSHLFEKDLYGRLSLESAVARRREKGGTAPATVRQALRRFRKKITGRN